MNNEEDENDYAVVEELPMENIISRDNISYDHVLDSAMQIYKAYNYVNSHQREL